MVVANIPELPAEEKPCYIKRFGRDNGSYIRTGDGDHKLSRYEIERLLENHRQLARYDEQIVPGVVVEDLDAELVAQWLIVVRTTSFRRAENDDDQTLMINRRVIAEDDAGVLRCTLAGLMSLGRYPQKFFPRLNVVFTAYPAVMKGENPRGVRYTDAVNIDGSIPVMIADTVTAVERNIARAGVVTGALREAQLEYPLTAVREAVANALIHRDYSPAVNGAPVRWSSTQTAWLCGIRAGYMEEWTWHPWVKVGSQTRETSSSPASLKMSVSPIVTASRGLL